MRSEHSGLSGPVTRRQLFRFTALGGSIAAGLNVGLLPSASAEAPGAVRSGLNAVPSGPGRRPAARIVVLGAGIAGLVTAYELGKQGYSCLLLEARDRAGGKLETVRAGSVVEEIDSRQVCSFSKDASIY